MWDATRAQPLSFCDPAAFAYDAEVTIALMADLQIRMAIERGEFDDLPGAGQPLDLPDRHDPDWWFKKLMKREGIALLPPSIQLRREDAALDEQLDQLHDETLVRHEIEQFNERVISARYQLPEGPPLITMPRDVEGTLAAWAERRAARTRAARETREQAPAPEPGRLRRRLRRFFSRRRQHPDSRDTAPTHQ